MYHIKPDRRSTASADALAQGLNICLKTMPLSAVTVTDLHRVTGISRSTFYRLFDTTEDILVYQCDQMLAQIHDIYRDGVPVSALDAMRKMILLGFENADFLESVVNNRRFDLLFEYTARRIFIITPLRQLFTDGLDESETEYMISNLAMSLVATLTTWVRRGRKESAEEVFIHNLRYWENLSMIIKLNKEEARND